MINTSTEYKKAIQKDREFRIQDTITFKDGTKQGKTITLSTGDFMSYSINGATSSSGKFDIGAAVIKKYTAVLNNMNDKFSEYDFEGADIRSYIGLKLEDGSWEVLSKGTYRVCKARSKDLTISIEAYDYMLFFDQPYSKSKLSYPATINEIIADACLCCQMTYNAQTIQNGRFTVEKRPEDEALTFRDIISYCAQIMCCYARISNANALEFGWYDFSIFDSNDNILDGGDLYDYTGSNADGGNFKDYTGDIKDGGSFTDQRDFHHLYLLGSQDIDVADIVITGVKATADNSSDDNNDKTESYLYGTEDYALSLEGNPLIQGGHTEEVARYVGPRIVGRRFRPLSITCLSDPSIEEGDVAYVTDRKNNTYKTVITNTTFSMGGYQSVVCDAETKTENNYTRYGAETKLLAQAHKDMQNEISQYDIAVQQLNSLALNSLGYYETITREDDGSMIKYMHDKPEMKDSKVVYKRSIDGFFISLDGGENFKSGFDKYGNAVLNVIQAIGINFDWAKGGTLTLGGKDHENGVLKLLDKDDNTIMTLTENGLNVLKGDISGSTITGSEFKNATGTFEISSEGILSSYSASKKRSLILDDAGIYVSGMTEAGYEGAYGLRCTSGSINADYHSQGIFFNKQENPDVITENDFVFHVRIEDRYMLCRCTAHFDYPVFIQNKLYAQEVTAGKFVNDSDPRLKDIESHITDAEKTLSKLETIIFRWKDEEDKKLHMGLNADNVQKVFGDEYGIVSEGREGYKGVSYIEIIPLLISAINSHSERLERIERKLDKLLQEGIG
ncbi:MAG: hypothetical protein RHS_6099 [Robinsoniella sp. RHS]|uniref:tail fiber domain-containing protein n=1 Tax=Robinsoniella sp. RHS TaxID=1504536 RepID=UPI000649E7A4|nr:MAG: hypothetical protein RHS_6099 [Robinsoniella sp. RHS]